jgi:hypothetical protein
MFDNRQWIQMLEIIIAALIIKLYANFETHLKFVPVIGIISKQLVEQLHTHYRSMWNESSDSCPILMWKFEISML